MRMVRQLLSAPDMVCPDHLREEYPTNRTELTCHQGNQLQVRVKSRGFPGNQLGATA